jgi:hypothetical protein
MSDQGQFYQRRLEAELSAAESASDPSVAQIHRDLAERYRRLLGDCGGADLAMTPDAAEPLARAAE